uniref:Uncharacterized protein n=1 Tax=Lotus japonicus TaxID=34305 RepID=I3SQT4_LOTJA|nr:unknown [Lotus japonicus]
MIGFFTLLRHHFPPWQGRLSVKWMLEAPTLGQTN